MSVERSINLRQKQWSVYNQRQVSRRPVNARCRGERPCVVLQLPDETIGVRNTRPGSFCISLSNCLAGARTEQIRSPVCWRDYGAAAVWHSARRSPFVRLDVCPTLDRTRQRGSCRVVPIAHCPRSNNVRLLLFAASFAPWHPLRLWSNCRHHAAGAATVRSHPDPDPSPPAYIRSGSLSESVSPIRIHVHPHHVGRHPRHCSGVWSVQDTDPEQGPGPQVSRWWDGPRTSWTWVRPNQ